MKNPTQYGQKLHPIKNQSFFRRTTIDGQIDLAMAAKLADIDIEMLYQLNPAFNQWATHPDGPHYLLLPKTKVTQFQKKLAKTPAKQRLRWKRHTIKDGETLSHIAKRYRITISVIRKVNRLPAKKSIRSGKHLMIPVAQKKPAHYSLSSTSRHKKRLQQSGKGHKILYTIRRGDTLWDIAQQYRVKTRQLERWNALSAKNLIRPGNTLIIWTNPKKTPNPLTQKTVYKVKPGDTLWDIANSYQIDISDLLSENKLNKDSILRPKQDLNIPANYQVSQEKPSNKQQYDYTVHTGDTLWEIAKKYHISIQDIRRWNHLSRKSILLTGQTLTLWLSDNNSPHINTVTESIIHYLPTPVSPMQQNMIRKITYTVRRGDSLARISDKFNVSIGKIKKWNPSTQKRTLQPGQKLKLRVDITQMPENI
jgi:membrane-bound lytic murein transglycosylase D